MYFKIKNEYGGGARNYLLYVQSFWDALYIWKSKINSRKKPDILDVLSKRNKRILKGFIF